MSLQPTMADIGRSQDEKDNLRRKLASGRYYRRAKTLHFTGWALAVAFALAAPIVLLFKESWGPTLGAIAGGWIFVSRFLLEPQKQKAQQHGAQAQEQYDCTVLGLPWNGALGRQMSNEEIHKASGSMKGVEKVKHWYPTDADLPWPFSVLVCQRSNAVWGRRQHAAFGLALRIAAGAWASIGIIVAVADGSPLAQYLTTIALPSLPALLDAAEMSRRHYQAADRRSALEQQTDDLLGAGADELSLREVQDQLFNLRRDEPLVPEWFYRLLRSNYEEDMHYAARRAAETIAARRGA
jgi:hypothetical protein